MTGVFMHSLIELVRKLFMAGGWAPILVFSIHAVGTRVFHVYDTWPQTDIPMHFAGGLSIAFFVSRCFRALPREIVRSSRIVVLELILAVSLTATAAMVWEFAEFTLDRVAGSNVQVSLPNTIQDMALGLLGAIVFSALRMRQLRAGRRELQEVTAEWIAGRAA